MATQVTKWAATDGKLFDTQAEADVHDGNIVVGRIVRAFLDIVVGDTNIDAHDFNKLCDRMRSELNEKNSRQLLLQALDLTTVTDN